MMLLLKLSIISLVGLALLIAPVQAQSQCSLNLQTGITCSDSFSGGTDCKSLTVNLTNQCTQNITVWYKFTICNLNNYDVTINASSSVIKSEYSTYQFSDTTLLFTSYPNPTCVTAARKGVLRNCDASSFAALSVNAKSPTNSHCFSYTKLDVFPILKTQKPVKRGSAAPTKFKPTKKPTRKPTKKPTAKPSKRVTQSPLKAPTPPTAKPLPLPTRKPTKFRSSKPTASICGVIPSVRIASITSTIQALSPATNQSLSITSSPQSQALNWLITQDGMKLCPGDLRIKQRFIMASFYFSTSGDTTWVGCGRNSVKTCKINWSFIVGDPITARYGNATWLSAVDECKWGGIACNDKTGMVDRIEFNSITSNKIGGSLPAEISLLTTMRFLIIEGCCSSSVPTYNATGFVGLSGKIPSNINSIQSLRVLDFAYNLLSGTIPSSLLSIQNISSIELNYNRFSGAFPSPAAGGPGTTAQLTKLRYIHIEGNAFTGSVPNLGTSTLLKNFTLQKNNFNGKVPDKLCTLRTGGGGINATLLDLWADCNNNAPIQCTCCTKCF